MARGSLSTEESIPMSFHGGDYFSSTSKKLFWLHQMNWMHQLLLHSLSKENFSFMLGCGNTLCMCVCVCYVLERVCVCVCYVLERECACVCVLCVRERVCVCVCMCLCECMNVCASVCFQECVSTFSLIQQIFAFTWSKIVSRTALRQNYVGQSRS